MAKRKLLPVKLSNAKLVAWKQIAPKSVFPLEHGSRAGIVVDKNGAPQLFIFDTFALLDVLSKIDEQLVDKLSSAEYHNKSINPSGWLIDKIEARLPLDTKYIQSLRDSIAEAQKKGWIPFEQIERELSLA